MVLYRRGAFLFSQSILPFLLNNVGSGSDVPHPPTLIFTGATASLKGSALCASFATGKFAMRALVQSLGREFGPKGVHVAHAIIDGVIDIPRTKEWKLEGEDAKISADAVSLFLRLPGPVLWTCGWRWKSMIEGEKKRLIGDNAYRSPMPTGTSIPSPAQHSHTKSISGRISKSGESGTSKTSSTPTHANKPIL